MSESQARMVARLIREEVALAPYDPAWPEMFQAEKRHLLACLPPGLLQRVEHFGSTAVPGLTAKPIVDMLVQVSSLEQARRLAPPILQAQGYEYLWRPTWGDDTLPWYAWFIKRNASGARTHHIHMVEAHFEHWDRLLFRDYLIEHPEEAARYGALKQRLASQHQGDRVAYTKAKTEFIVETTQKAKRFYAGKA